MENFSLENYLEWSINNGTIEEAYNYLLMTMQNYRQVKVEPAGICYFEQQSQYYSQMNLFYCPNLHSFCLYCLKEYIKENFLKFKLRIEYLCPYCQTCTFYTHGKKLEFLKLVIGDLNTYISQSINIPIPISNNFNQTISQNSEPELIELNPNSEDYYSVAENFFTTVKNKRIIKILKINNPNLEQKFNYRKNQFFSYGYLCKQETWHGTKSLEIYKKIINQGFLIGGVDVKVNNGTAFGAGVNTSLEASVCISYCENCGYILLCEVVTGKETTIPNNNDEQYNSFRGKNVLILYDSSQLMPRFLVNFK